MKTYVSQFTFLFFVSLFLTGCDLEDPEPSTNATPIFLKKISTSQGDSREFQYSATGWLTRVVGAGQLALNENPQSTSEVVYDNVGRISYLLTDGPILDTENAYYYTANNQLYKLDELINDKVESYHTFEYDVAGRLATRFSFYKDAGSTVPRETNKVTYTYDATGNVNEMAMYRKATATSAWELVQTSKYENYDTKKGVQHLGDFLFTPTIVLFRNNPGKVTTTLANGEQRVTNFTYEYNAQNLPVKKTTSPVSGPPFQTEYTYVM
ncbi:hypothetical protein [Rufibacter latericius]|uniref:DUF4595 domain-containing protein n=1 Tax=Rufibacter latericius TaxID=2487040 RepID=A0A3M9MDK4_9BACT|nr:hypothetical protein [Rufibacter latericius]RNI23584.1 hypothetical protein EFB08_18820 [Rufibacter latericius]